MTPVSSWKDIKKFYTHFQKVLEQRIEEITQELEDKRPIKKKESKRRKKKVQSIINKGLKPYYEAYKVLDNNQEAFAGAMGEEAVIGVLSKLNDSYYVFNDITLALPQTVLWKKHQEYVKSAQIDHLVISPSGIFLIDECYIESLGARYEVEELWFSLKYYEENYEFLEKHQRNKRKRLKECPGYIATTLELHKRRLDEIRNEKHI